MNQIIRRAISTPLAGQPGGPFRQVRFNIYMFIMFYYVEKSYETSRDGNSKHLTPPLLTGNTSLSVRRFEPANNMAVHVIWRTHLFKIF